MIFAKTGDGGFIFTGDKSMPQECLERRKEYARQRAESHGGFSGFVERV